MFLLVHDGVYSQYRHLRVTKSVGEQSWTIFLCGTPINCPNFLIFFWKHLMATQHEKIFLKMCKKHMMHSNVGCRNAIKIFYYFFNYKCIFLVLLTLNQLCTLIFFSLCILSKHIHWKSFYIQLLFLLNFCFQDSHQTSGRRHRPRRHRVEDNSEIKVEIFGASRYDYQEVWISC